MSEIVPSLEELPDALTIPEVSAFLRLGRNGVYESIRRGEIPAVRIGRRLLVPKRGLARLLAGAEAGAGAEPVAPIGAAR